MKVLIACEFSGTVRDAFRALGHDAWSCDLLPTEKPGPHIMDDVRNVLDAGWDLMIAHPPCEKLAYSGNAHWNDPGRAVERTMAADFFMQLYDAPIPRIAVENPVGWMNTVFRKPDQIIHPYYFGEPFLKKTCLWLKNLPVLGGMKFTTYPEPIYVTQREDGLKLRHWSEASHGAQKRSRTFPGIAAAMAAQWSDLSSIPVQGDLWGAA